MITDNIIDKIRKITGADKVYLNVPMSEYTTFNIGGKAEVICEPQTKEQIVELIKILESEKVNYYIIGNGSNLLVSDDGFKGVIIRLLDEFSEIRHINSKNLPKPCTGTDSCIYIKAQAGVRMWRLGMYLAGQGASGFEFATGIPGTIGGAVVMNAGAYGGEMKDVVHSVVVTGRDGKITVISGNELEFGYRTSAISKRGLIVLEVILCLPRGDENAIKERIEELAEKRRTKQPLDRPSAGSTFKRPEGHYAAQLIDEAGLRGFSVGGAQVSEKHAGFVINTGSATARDVIDLTDRIKEEIYKKDNVELELEVRKLGF